MKQYTYLIDTDVLIWYLKGNLSAFHALESISSRVISCVTYMEWVQGLRNKEELKLLKQFSMGD